MRQIKLFKDICEYIGLSNEDIDNMLTGDMFDGSSKNDISKLDDVEVLNLIFRELEYRGNLYFESGRNEKI